MAIDPARATFVNRDYRFEIQTDNTVLAAYPAAREIELPANIDQTSAATLSANILNAAKAPAMVFEVEVDQVKDCDGKLPMFAITSAIHSVTGRTVRVEEMQVDWATGVTKLVVRG